MKRTGPAALAGLILAAFLGIAAAPDPAERLPDPGQEARARTLFQQLRCVVCQNESIDDSEADLASDLRRIVRAQIAAGRTDAQVRDFLVQRYGQFILLRPPLDLGNAALWLTPLGLLVLGGGYIAFMARRPAASAESALSPEEEQALARLASGQGETPARQADPKHAG